MKFFLRSISLCKQLWQQRSDKTAMVAEIRQKVQEGIRVIPPPVVIG